MKINEKLLHACRNRDIPYTILPNLLKPIQGTTGEERTALQNRIAEEIERRYPLRELKPGKERFDENIRKKSPAEGQND